tara:strand:+ start:1004 stop:1306 length:303 start_codon:yes stop_codon:yes gene_type:complete
MSSDLTVNKLFNRKNNVLELSESIELSEKLHEIKERISENRSNIETYSNNLEEQEMFLEEVINAVNGNAPQIQINGKIFEISLCFREVEYKESSNISWDH